MTIPRDQSTLAEAANTVAERAKRLESMGSNSGLLIGAFVGALFVGPRIKEWDLWWAFALVAVLALGGMLIGALLASWLIGAQASGGMAHGGDGIEGSSGGGDGGDAGGDA